jgi:hypothetical protein
LSPPEVFGYGAGGSLITFAILFVVPEFSLVLRGEKRLGFDIGRIIAAIVLAALFLAIGGFLTLTVSGAATVKDAVVYGLGMQTLVSGTLKGILRP